MRIHRLDLIRIGPFTGRSLSFTEGDFGFHVIYGPNEGGKSSSLRAMKQWLFGIKGEKSCRDHFVHTHNELRVGGVIEGDDGKRLACIRRKGGQKSLRGEDDKSIVSLDDFNDCLHRLSEEQFETQFGIDLEQLVAGGREIVANGGDVGGSLFAAGSGTARVGAVGKWLDSECDRLFKLTGSRPAINAAIAQYSAACKVVSEKSVPSKQWQSQKDALEQSLSKRRDLDKQILDLETSLQGLDRIRQALPTISSLKDERASLAEVADAPRLRSDFSEIRAAAVFALSAATTSLKSTETDLASITARIDALDVPQSVLDHASAIKNLYKNLERYLDWVRNCPELKSKRKTLETRAERTLLELGKDPSADHAEQVRIGTTNRLRINELAEQRSALMQSAEAAAAELADKQRVLKDAETAMSALPKPVDTSSLRTAIDNARKLGDCEQQLAAQEAKLAESRSRGQREIAKLPLWTGTIEELESLPIPSSESIARYETELAAADQNVRSLQAEIADLEDKIADADTRLSALQLTQDVPTEDDLDGVRLRRDELWNPIAATFSDRSSVQSPPSSESIDEYEALVRQADEMSDRLRREAERVAEKTRWIADRNGWGTSLENRRTRLEAAKSDRANTHADWRELWLLANIDPLAPVEMKVWMENHRKISELASLIREQDQACESNRSNIDSHRQSLLARLGEVDTETDFEPTASLASLIDIADQRSKSFETIENNRLQLQTQLTQYREECGNAKTKLTDANEKKERWQTEWMDAVKVLDGNANLSASGAMAMLQTIDQLVHDIDEAEKLARDWNDHHTQIEAYDDSVLKLTETIGLDVGEASVSQTVADLQDQLGRATEQKATRDSLIAERDRIEKKMTTAKQSIINETARLDELRREAGCETTDDLPNVERQSVQRISIEQEIDTQEKLLRQWTQGAELDTFIAAASAEDPDRLGPQIDQLAEQIEQAKKLREELSESIGAQQKDLDRIDGSSDAAKANEDAEVALSQVREHAETYSRMKLASVVLKRAVHRYREQNQGPVLQRASVLFAELTLGAFEGLRSDFGDDGEPILVGVRASSSQSESLVTVDGMSEGTCDQLFLALRIASLELHFQSNPPVPFVIDDILVKFDDKRSAAAMRILAELSKQTQVIMFTHHDHLIEVARAAVPAEMLFVQSLEDGGTHDEADQGTPAVVIPKTPKPKRKRATKETPPIGELF
ncbi:YhaN family protein [Rubripirellula reticaptiva]|uniref:Chromosome partition protein Smc n=1 Tax=Rubripirellula reticaptiva TaxID=2528013 RepID=A0A5C6EN52_9BACT|nr:YhaN family protein [Rubripirellula reticaptiva]TWU51163.1 Chromosome partition protein Smc [Rubripirellula reticaptiva]